MGDEDGAATMDESGRGVSKRPLNFTKTGIDADSKHPMVGTWQTNRKVQATTRTWAA